MPSKKNRQRRKQNRKNRASGVPSTIQPMNRLQRAYFGYGYYSTITEPSASTGAIYQFRLNSIYDPDFSSTGSTAQGYSAYTGLYALFRVLRTRVCVTFYSGTTGNMTVGFVPGLNSTVTSNFAYLHAQPFAKSCVLQGNTGGAHSVKKWDVTFDLAKIAGVTKQQYMNENEYAHNAGSNPARGLYLTLFLNGHAATVQSVGFEIRIVYDTEMSQPLASVVS